MITILAVVLISVVAVVAAVAIVAVLCHRRRLAAPLNEDPGTSGPSAVPPGPLTRVRGDFNGVFGQLLCLSHQEYALDGSGAKVWLREGMAVLAYDEDADENNQPDNIVAVGIVERPPRWLQHRGSQWVLRIDANGIRHESEMRAAEQGIGADEGRHG